MMAEPPFPTLKAAFSSARHTNRSTGGASEQAALFSGLFSLSSSCLEARAEHRHPPDHTHPAISDHCLPRQHPYQPGKVPLLNRKVIGCQLVFLFHFRHNPACRNPTEQAPGQAAGWQLILPPARGCAGDAQHPSARLRAPPTCSVRGKSRSRAQAGLGTAPSASSSKPSTSTKRQPGLTPRRASTCGAQRAGGTAAAPQGPATRRGDTGNKEEEEEEEGAAHSLCSASARQRGGDGG